MGIDILSEWSVTATELSEIAAEKPSMRGLMFGFVAEYKLKKEWLLRPGIENLTRPRSHDRKQKYDFCFDYRGLAAKVEVKCLDTPKVKVLGRTSTRVRFSAMPATPLGSRCRTEEK